MALLYEYTNIIDCDALEGRHAKVQGSWRVVGARCKMYSNTQTRSMWRKHSLDKRKEEITRKENKGPRKDANGTQKKINGSKDKQIELNGS